MAKTLVEVDEQRLAAAQEVLRTKTNTDTVNAALGRSKHWLHAAGISSGSALSDSPT
jgi:Arc/MetJ family transcription regulator